MVKHTKVSARGKSPKDDFVAINGIKDFSLEEEWLFVQMLPLPQNHLAVQNLQMIV